MPVSYTHLAANEELASYTASQKEALLELEKITDEEKSLSSQMEQLEKAILEDEIELNEQNEQIMDSMNASSKITVEQQKAKSMLEPVSYTHLDVYKRQA